MFCMLCLWYERKMFRNPRKCYKFLTMNMKEERGMVSIKICSIPKFHYILNEMKTTCQFQIQNNYLYPFSFSWCLKCVSALFYLFIYSFLFFFTIQYFVHLRKQQDIIHFFSFLTVDRMSQFRIRWLICYLEHRQWHLLYETISQPQEKKKVRDYKYHAESRKQNTREAMLTLSLHFHN